MKPCTPFTYECQAIRLTRYYREHKPGKCVQTAQYEHAGRKLCKQHAAILALNLVLRRKQNER